LAGQGKLNTLPLSTFIELIKSEKVAAAEEEIFDAVVAYAKFQRDTQVRRPSSTCHWHRSRETEQKCVECA
jgi:hypothetical protein